MEQISLATAKAEKTLIHSFIAMAAIFSIFTIFIIWSYQASPSNFLLLIYFGALPTICLWSCVCCGKSERKGS